MIFRRTFAAFLVLCCLVAGLTGCLATGPEGGEATDRTEDEVQAHNALLPNGVMGNGLLANGATVNGLLANGLTTNGLLANGYAMQALDDPLTQHFFSYVVSCALPSGWHIDLPVGTFWGQLGLTPEWGVDGGSCSEECQQWISACVLARVNYQGHHIALSMRGTHPALAPDLTEILYYSKREGAYFGNIFRDPGNQRRHGSREPTRPNLSDRVCGYAGNPSCVVQDLTDYSVCYDPYLALAPYATPGVPYYLVYYYYGYNDSTAYDSDTYFSYFGNYTWCSNLSGEWYRAITVFRQDIDEDNPYGDK